MPPPDRPKRSEGKNNAIVKYRCRQPAGVTTKKKKGGADFWGKSVDGQSYGFTEPDARPFEGRCMTYGVEFLGFLLRCLRNSMFAPLTRAPHLLLKEFYDLALSAPAALSLEATSRVASSWLFRFHVARPFEGRCMGYGADFCKKTRGG